MKLAVRDVAPDWLPRLLNQVSGIEAHPGPNANSIAVVVNGGRTTNFDVYFLPVVSWERAEEIIRTWRLSAPTPRSMLIATRYLSSATRELLREEGLSWAEEGTGICRLSAPGLLVDVRVEYVQHRQPSVRAFTMRERGRGDVMALPLSFIPEKSVGNGEDSNLVRPYGPPNQ